MDAHLMSKINCKTKAEKPFCNDRFQNEGIDEDLFKGVCKLKNDTDKSEKYNACLRKPNAKEEILILICIIKKGMKILCQVNQNSKSPGYERIYFFVDITKKLDKFKEKFERIFSGRNNLCCYSKLLRELKSVRHSLCKEIEDNYDIYRCKMDLINCLMASCRSIENKIYQIMASSEDNNHRSCDRGCEDFQSTSKLSKFTSKLSCKSSNQSLKKKNSSHRSLKKDSVKDLCKCIDDNKAKSNVYDLTLEYCKYKTDNNRDSSSDGDSDTECIRKQLPNGYVLSKILKSEGAINLSIKYVTTDDLSIMDGLKKEVDGNNAVNLMKLAEDMTKMLTVSKDWLASGREMYQQILKKC